MATRESVFYLADPSLLILILFMGMMTLMKLGSYIGHRLRIAKDNIENPGNATVLAAVFGLFAFLLGFTFSMSGGRYESRRLGTIREANAIGTAILRADLYSPDERVAYRKVFKSYTQARIAYFTSGRDKIAMAKAATDARFYGKMLWQRASDSARKAGTLFPANFMIPSLNEMLDAASSNDYAEKLRVPDPIVILLFALSLVCSFFVGYHSSRKGRFDWVIATGFCLLSSLVIFITLDLDRPRSGLIRLNSSHQAMTDLIQLFDQP